jgi:hypothetical protein
MLPHSTDNGKFKQILLGIRGHKCELGVWQIAEVANAKYKR